MDGFEWVDVNHRDESVIVYKRKGKKSSDDLLIILNLTPVPRMDWEIEVQGKSFTKEIFNSDSTKYWGSGTVYNPAVRKMVLNREEKKYKIMVNLPALSGIILK
jgi:1,4-alpha-glucan branching enzyme